MDYEKEVELIAQLRRDMPRNGVVMSLCDFAEKCLGSKPKMSEVERRQKNAERVKRWRRSKGLVGGEVIEISTNPFEGDT